MRTTSCTIPYAAFAAIPPTKTPNAVSAKRSVVPHEVRDAGGEETEVEHELDEPLAELRDPLRRVEVEEADQVDGEEPDGERERDQRGARKSPVPRRDAVDRERAEEERGQDVRERQRPADRPVHLLERDAEDRREEEEAGHVDVAEHARELLGARPSVELRAELRRERRAVERPGGPARVQVAQRGLDRVDVVGRRRPSPRRPRGRSRRSRRPEAPPR